MNITATAPRASITIVLFVLGFWALDSPSTAEAQLCVAPIEGFNAVYGTCNNNTSLVATSAFVDAAAWCNGNCVGEDICALIGNAIGNLPTGAGGIVVGGVIDARGVVNTDGTPISCTNNPFPQSNPVPLTVLLPASYITIQHPWVLPSNTRIVGQGLRTTLQASSTPLFINDSSDAMIEMGSSTCPPTGCTGISIEHLRLDGNTLDASDRVALTGIYNGFATDSSYVNDVTFQNIGANSTQTTLTTGLLIDSNAVGSGPYTNLYFTGDTSVRCSPYTCQNTAAVQIRAATRGLHGITTTAHTDPSDHTPPNAAIYLDASNNTIEDVHNEGFYDAIVVGANVARSPGPFAGNTISNVTGEFGGRGPTYNAVHICSPVYGNQTGACNSHSAPVTDLTLLQIESAGAASQNFPATTIKDDVTSTIINSSENAAFAATYVLGETAAPSQYTRLTTAPSVPTWGVGANDVSGQSCATLGALYSNTGGGTTQNANTLFVCSNIPIGLTWTAFK